MHSEGVLREFLQESPFCKNSILSNNPEQIHNGICSGNPGKYNYFLLDSLKEFQQEFFYGGNC